MKTLLVALCLVLGLVATAYAAGPYYNSTEPACDGSDPNVVWCEDFEDGVWYQTDCDHGGPDAIANNGWCGNIYSSSPATATTPGAAGSQYSAGSGGLNGGGGRMADHNFAPNKSSYDELYMRHYRKFDLSQFGQEKFWSVNKCCAGVGGIYFASHWSYPNGSFARIHLEVPNEVRQGGGLRLQNVSTLDMTRGNWYYIEIHMKLNTPGVANGVWEMWIDNCGTNGTCTGSSPTLRARHTNVMWRAAGDNSQMGSAWLENWSAPGSFGAQYPSIGQEYYDKIKVARTGPIGFAGASGPVPPPPPPPTSCVITPTPAALAFTHPVGGPLPAPQSIMVMTSDLSAWRTDDTGFYDASLACWAGGGGSCASGQSTTVTPSTLSLSFPANTYTYPLSIKAGVNCPEVIVPVVLVVGAPAPPPPPPVSTLSVYITQPKANATVKGTVWVVMWVEGTSAGSNIFTLSADGTQIATRTTTSKGPVSIPWQTQSLTNGAHTLTGTVRDATGNTGTKSITVIVTH